MAKKTKETSTPLVFALVFFVLTTIAFGVMWYLAYSDQETNKAEVAQKIKDKQDVTNLKIQAELMNSLYRVYIGVPDAGDADTLNGAAKAGDKLASELDRLNTKMAEKVGVANADALPEEFRPWTTDKATNKINLPPNKDKGITDAISELRNKNKTAYESADVAAKAYNAQVKSSEAAVKNLENAEAAFKKAAKDLPTEVQNRLTKQEDDIKKAKEKYTADVAAAENATKEARNKSEEAEGEVRRLKNRIASLEETNKTLAVREGKADAKVDRGPPQGKVLRVLPDGVLEINLGSAVSVKPGLTFTILPSDFEAKGEQSRMRKRRIPDGKGGFTDGPPEFIARAGIEVYEVVGPNLSLARYKASDPLKGEVPYGVEMDPIRDGIIAGDLLYNAVWRKGVSDRVALIGVFDINGDGQDDIRNVVRDLKKMGIEVDAFYDMKERKWVGEVTERTRYVIEGQRPAVTGGADPLLEQKTKLTVELDKAVRAAREKGVDRVNYRDFFTNMGYKFRLDVAEDTINRATGPYLDTVIGGGAAPSP